jgi:pimeloyl-ACP methyl ester carboxylesterase
MSTTRPSWPRPWATRPDRPACRSGGCRPAPGWPTSASRAPRPFRPSPVVVLHGGPGVPDVAGDAAFFGQLTADGFDVYVYEQLGAGRSSRLADPTGYGLDRDVADPEAVRQTVGAERLVLIGHSHGGALAAAYLAGHPDHVQSMVLSSPAPLDPADTTGDDAVAPDSLLLEGRVRLQDRARAIPLAPSPAVQGGYALPAVATFLRSADTAPGVSRPLRRAAFGCHVREPPRLQRHPQRSVSRDCEAMRFSIGTERDLVDQPAAPVEPHDGTTGPERRPAPAVVGDSDGMWPARAIR